MKTRFAGQITEDDIRKGQTVYRVGNHGITGITFTGNIGDDNQDGRARLASLHPSIPADIWDIETGIGLMSEIGCCCVTLGFVLSTSHPTFRTLEDARNYQSHTRKA